MYTVYIDYCPLWIIGMHIQVVLLPSLDFLQWQWWTGQALVTGADRSLSRRKSIVKDAWLPNKR